MSLRKRLDDIRGKRKRPRLVDPRNDPPRESTPDRPAPTLMICGQYGAFSKSLEGLNLKILERAPSSTWLTVYSGPGYKDFDVVGDRKMAERTVKFFLCQHPKMRVKWLKPVKETGHAAAYHEEWDGQVGRGEPQRRRVQGIRNRLPRTRETGRKK